MAPQYSYPIGLISCNCASILGKSFSEKPGPYSAGEHEPVWSMVADQQGTKMAPASFRQCIAADNEFLRLGDLEFDPGTATPAAFVERIWSFGDQSLETKLLRDPEQLIFGAAELIRKPDIFGQFLEHLSEEFAPGAQRLVAQIFPVQEEKIEDVIDQRGGSRAFEYLEELER